MIEMLKNILDMLQRDPIYKRRADHIYKKRVFELHIRNLEIFRGLTNEEFQEINNNVELVSFEPGEIICDEHERSDCMYIVRGGLVKVMKNASHLLSQNDVTDWNVFLQALRRGETTPASPHGKFWKLLPDRIRQILLASQNLATLNAADRMEVVYALNDVLKSPKTAEVPEFKPIVESPPFKAQVKGLPEKRTEWSDGNVRLFNRLLLETLYPQGLRQHRKHAGPETILAYISKGDYFGEMGLMLNQPRSATCVAFGHPNEHGIVELVRIPGRTFWYLMKSSESIRNHVKQVIADRRKRTLAALTTPITDDSHNVQYSESFAELGLIQGQKLMLIDLDRCTRCDECVKACVNTHNDGYSRLFLDGPRFGKYLVPTACRSCLDPVCMIPCPVGSIHRGENREMIIEDWCIGCSACADACPYGSIQMQDLGIIPESTRGWRWLPAAAPAARGEWYKPKYRDAKWLPGESPFFLDRDLKELLLRYPTPAGEPANEAINFRLEFYLDKHQLPPDRKFLLGATTLGPSLKLWLNGRELTVDDKPKRGRHEFSLPPKTPPARPASAPGNAGSGEAAPPQLLSAHDFLHAGTNLVAVQVMPTSKSTDVLLQLRLDEVRKPKLPSGEMEENLPDEITEKMVTQVAVVCDLCSSIPGKVPACVNACPHDAAMRVDARTEFPTR